MITNGLDRKQENDRQVNKTVKGFISYNALLSFGREIGKKFFHLKKHFPVQPKD